MTRPYSALTEATGERQPGQTRDSIRSTGRSLHERGRSERSRPRSLGAGCPTEMRATVLDRFDQPIRAPGGRLLQRAGLKYFRCRERGARPTDLQLPLVPCVDFVLCVVLFLIAQFHVSSDCSIRHNVDHPRGRNTLSMVDAPMILLTGRQILVDGVPVGNTRQVQERASVTRLDELYSIMKNKRDLWRQINPDRSFPGVAIIRAERRTAALVIKSVFQTTAFAGYANISFAVDRLPPRD